MKKSVFRTSLIVLSLASLLGIATPALRAQEDQAATEEESSPMAQSGSGGNGKVVLGKKGLSIPYKFRKMLEDDALRRQHPKETPTHVTSTPWLAPNGERLVGIVEGRMLTKPQLDMRVNMMVQHQPPLDDPVKEQDRRIIYESRILAEWAKMTALAVCAEKAGFNVTPAEMEKVMHELSSQSVGDAGKANEQMRLIGIPERELRQELHDGILIEKMVRDSVERIEDAKLKAIFEKSPQNFLRPTTVSAWQLFAPSEQGATHDQVAGVEKDLARYGKRLAKCRTQDDYQALQKELAGRKDLVISYIDNIVPNEPLPDPDRGNRKAIMQALFGLEPGRTSKVIDSQIGRYLVKVYSRAEGHRGSFEEGKPQVQNYLIEKIKDSMYAMALQKVEIHINSAGLSKYKDVGLPGGRAPAGAARAAATRPTPTKTPPPLLRANGGAADLVDAAAATSVPGNAPLDATAASGTTDAAAPIADSLPPVDDTTALSSAAPAFDVVAPLTPATGQAAIVRAPSREEEIRRRLGLETAVTTSTTATTSQSLRRPARRRTAATTRKLFSDPPPVAAAISQRQQESDVSVK